VKIVRLAIALLSAQPCHAVTLPFIHCKSINSVPANQTMEIVLNTNLVFPAPADPTHRQAKISFNGVSNLYTMKPVTTAGTGTVYNYLKDKSNIEINLPITASTLTMASAITRKFYTTAQLEFMNIDYKGVPYQIYSLVCQPIKPFLWQ